MSPTTVVFLVHVLVIVTRQRPHMVSAMLPFGDSFAGSQSAVGSAVSLPSNFTFYEQSYATIYASIDGFVSFTESGDVYDVRDGHNAVTFPVMCIFCTDIEPRRGPILAHLSTEASDLQTIANLARKYEEFGSTYSPAWAFVVTWDDVVSFGDNEQGNTMQMVVASDGTKSLVMYEYVTINWYKGFGGIPMVFTWVGFSNGDGANFYNFEESNSENLTHLNSSTNIGLDGFFLFRVDQSTINAEPVAIPTTPTEPTTTPTTITEPTTTPTTITEPTTTPTTITEPTTTPTTITEPTTTPTITHTPMNGSTSPAVTNSESQVTTVSTTEETKSSSFDSTPYIVGVGVSVGMLTIIGTVAIVVYKMKVKGRFPPARAAGKVSPAPPGTADGVPNHYSSAAPVSGLLALRAPFRIPRPTSSPVPVHSVSSRVPSSSGARRGKPVTSHAVSVLNDGVTPRSAPSFMSLVV